MKISQNIQQKTGLYLLLIFVIVLGIVSLRQFKNHIEKTETLYRQVLLGERSISMLYNCIYGLHRDMKDLSLDSTEAEIGIELEWINWWKLRASGQIDTIYTVYSGQRRDIDSLKNDYVALVAVCENTIELMRSNGKHEVISRTKTNGIISRKVQKLLAKLDEINKITTLKDDELYTNLVQLGNSYKKRMLLFILVIILLSVIINLILSRIYTRRIQTEELLRESEERFQLLFDKAPLGYQSLDANGNFIEVNQKWLDTLGYYKSEVTGKWFGDFLSPEYKDGFRERFPLFKAKGKIHSEFEMVHKNGTKLFIAFEGKVGYDLNGGFKQTHCILQDITDKKRSEEELKKSEEKLRFYTDNSPMAVIEWDSDFIVTRWSGYSEKIFGWKSEEILGNNIMDLNFVFESDIPIVENTMKLLVNGKSKQVVASNRNYKKDGSVIICTWYNTVLKDQNDKMISIMSQALDITQSRLAEKALRESEELYRSLFDNMLNGFAYCQMHFNEDGKPWDFTYLSVNKAFDSLTGLSNVTGKKATEIIPNIREEDMDLLEIYGRVSNSGEPVHFESYVHALKDWYSVSVYCPKEGFFVAVFEVITERKKTEIKLAESQKFQSQIINSVQEGIIVYDLNLRYQVWNPFMEKFSGLPATKVIGKYPTDLFPFLEEAGVIEKLKKTMKGEILPATDFPFQLPETGKNGWASDKNMPFRDMNGEIIGVIGTVHDITDRKQSEIDLLNSKEKAEESERLKSAFLANMSHEIRTPMNGILGFAELLKEPSLTPAEQQEFIQTIQISGTRMLNTLNNIVDVSKIESGLMNVDIKETNINEKIEFIYKFFKPEVEGKGLKFLLKNRLPLKEVTIKSDNEKVYGILTNLIKNAIKFTFKGSIEFGYEKKGEYLEFFVKDTGVGIPVNQTELIFERFRQGSDSLNRTFEGSGLGLSICKSYVEMLGGRIWVESKEGKGSSFYFTIPFNAVPKEKGSTGNAYSEEHKKGELQRLKILIVEDDEISYSLLTRTLQTISREVLHAITGIEAVEICQNNPDIDLVLMDIRMPKMNGLEATRLIRQFNSNITIIAQTAYGFSSDCEKALDAGCNDYISKPIRKAELFGLIDKHLNQSV